MQKETEKTQEALEGGGKLKGGRVLPNAKVWIEWTTTKHGKKDGEKEEVHPNLAEKLIEKGFAKKTTAPKKDAEKSESSNKAKSITIKNGGENQ